jgi:hypothetical protein
MASLKHVKACETLDGRIDLSESAGDGLLAFDENCKNWPTTRFEERKDPNYAPAGGSAASALDIAWPGSRRD